MPKYPVQQQYSETGSITSVPSSATDVTLLPANKNRVGAKIFNNELSILYVAESAVTSSATLFTVQIPSKGFYEVTAGYVGILKGIWASAGALAALCTEYT